MSRGAAWLSRLLLKTAFGIERVAAYAQGKGYGTSSIRRENTLVHQLLNRQPQFEMFRITPLGLDRITRYRELHEFFSTTNFIAAKRS
jgi:hypothetical protein